MGMQQGTWQDPQSSWYRQPVAEDAPWWAQMAGSDPLMSIPGAQTLRGAGQQFMGETAGNIISGAGRMLMPGAMASQNVRQGDYGAAGVDLGLDMLPLGGLARGAFRGGRRFVKEAGGNLENVNWQGMSPFNFKRQTPYGAQSGGFMNPAQYTRPFRQEGTDRLVVGRQNVGGGNTRMFSTDQSGMNFRPMEDFSSSGSPQRIPGRRVGIDDYGRLQDPTNYGGSMMPGDQEFMDMLNARYGFPSGAMPSTGSIAEGSAQGRLANTLSRAPQKTADELNLMQGIKSGRFKPEPSQFITPPGLQSQYATGMASPVGQFIGGIGLTTAPGVARTARGDMEEQFQQRPEYLDLVGQADTAGQLRRNVTRRADPRPGQGRRGTRTGDTGG